MKITASARVWSMFRNMLLSSSASPPGITS